MSNPNSPSESTDPYQEPPNSTVDDWHGQVVDEAAERADDALQAGESPEEAERRYTEAIERAASSSEQGA